MMDGFMQLVKDMRAAQKEYFSARKQWGDSRDALQRSKALEKRVDAEKHRGLLLPTPQASEGEKYTNTWNPNSQNGMSLSARAANGMLPTPQTHGLKVCDKNGKTQFMDLDMLPTPTARDEKNGCGADSKRIERKKEQGWTIELNDLAAMDMLPTPIARCWKGGSAAERKDTGKVRTDQLDTYVETQMSPEQDGKGFRLSPLFTEEMMGFPLMWTAWPFLQYQHLQPTEKETRKSTRLQNGAPKPSKPTETPSSRK